MSDKTSCELELPAMPPFPGVYPRDAICDPSTVLGAPANPGVEPVNLKALPVEAKDDDAMSVVSGPNASLRTCDCTYVEGDPECDDDHVWTTDEDAEELRETAKYDAEIYHQLGDFIPAYAPPTGRDLFPPVAAAEPPVRRHRPKRGCVVCWTITRKSCSRCRSARYCSKECQAEAWPLHKDHCNHYRYLKRYLIPEVAE